MAWYARVFRHLMCLLIVLNCFGCEQSQIPERGFVKGKVTMNGIPLVGADIEARPMKGRPAYGVIQPDGSFEIMYKKNVPGTLLGINKFTPLWPTSVRGPSFPQEYLNVEFEVKPGDNTFVLDMKSDRQEWKDFKPLPQAEAPTMTPLN